MFSLPVPTFFDGRVLISFILLPVQTSEVFQGYVLGDWTRVLCLCPLPSIFADKFSSSSPPTQNAVRTFPLAGMASTSTCLNTRCTRASVATITITRRA